MVRGWKLGVITLKIISFVCNTMCNKGIQTLEMGWETMFLVADVYRLAIAVAIGANMRFKTNASGIFPIF